MRRKKEYFEGLVKSGNKEKRKTRKRHKEEKKISDGEDSS